MTIAAMLGITLACKIASPICQSQLAGNTLKLRSLWAAKQRSLCPQLDTIDLAPVDRLTVSPRS